MQQIEYLEIDSTFRNRSKFPDPNFFETDTLSSTSRDYFYDPISYATPIHTFIPSENELFGVLTPDFDTSYILSVQRSGVMDSKIVLPVGLPAYGVTLDYKVSLEPNYYRSVNVNLFTDDTGGTAPVHVIAREVTPEVTITIRIH